LASALYTALSGIEASLTRADVSANNVANVNTTAFKSSRVNQVERYGGGTRVSSVDRDQTQGAPQATGRPLDTALVGDGFIRIQTEAGEAYTRDGALQVDADRFLVTANGARVGGGIRVPVGSNGLRINVIGDVYAQFNARERLLGRIDFTEFANYAGLKALGANEYQTTAASGAPRPAPANVESGYLEASNTNLAAEIIQNVAAAVGVQANVTVVRTADDLQGTLLDMVK